MKKHKGINYSLKLSMLMVSFLFVIIIVKLVYVATSSDVDGIDLRAFADARNTENKTLYAARGTIYDRKGNILAIDTNSYTVIAYLASSRTTKENNPQHVVDKAKTASLLAPILERDEATLLELLSRDKYQIELKRGITETRKNEIEALNLPGIDFVGSTKRYYPYGNYAPYILGYALPDDNGEIKGEMGLEYSFNDTLKGENGYMKYQKDLKGYRIPNTWVDTKESVSGSSLYLTLDQDVQLILENAIKNMENNFAFKWATLTIMDAKTGAILGNANNPSFDLNTRDDLDSYLNPLISYTYEPGSVMKVFSFMKAIEDGYYDGASTFMSGSISLSDGTKIKDFNNTGWGTIDYDTGFAYSSNVAATKLALKIGAKELRDFYESLGFGAKTGIELSGELEGSNNFIYESELATASFGQGRITVTPIQMLQALSVLANDGVMVKPYVVEKVVNEKNEVVREFGRQEVKNVAKPETVLQVRNLMNKVIYDGIPSTKNFAPSNVTIIGKTGTAQIANPKGGYLKGDYDYVKSFAGLFPAEEPKYIIYISIKQLIGGTNDIADVVRSVVEEVAKTLHLVEEKDNILETKVVTLSNYISNQIVTTEEKLKSLGLNPIILGEGKFVVNQYPLDNLEILKGSKVFLMSNDISYKMPDVTGFSTNEIVTMCNILNIPYKINGSGYVVSTNVEVGSVIDPSVILEINLVN